MFTRNLPVLFFALLTGMCESQNSCSNESCANPDVCKSVEVEKFGPVITTPSPLYDLVIYDNAESNLVDSVCTTGLDIGGGDNLIFRTSSFSNGTVIVSKLIQSAVPGTVGIYRWQGKGQNDGCSSCVFNDYILGELEPPCEGIYVNYICFLYGSCVTQYSGQDTVVVSSINATVPEQCYGRIQTAAGAAGLNLGRYNRLPMMKSKNCVTKVGNAYTIDACAVSACDALELE